MPVRDMEKLPPRSGHSVAASRTQAVPATTERGRASRASPVRWGTHAFGLPDTRKKAGIRIRIIL
jgi:hypothetical protein